jgi:hypothetical protein
MASPSFQKVGQCVPMRVESHVTFVGATILPIYGMAFLNTLA